jgi:hypothetical protein
LIVGLERFEKCHARCHNREDVRGTLANYFGTADLKLFFGSIDDR